MISRLVGRLDRWFWSWVARKVCQHSTDQMLRLWETSAELRTVYDRTSRLIQDEEEIRERLTRCEVTMPRVPSRPIPGKGQ